MNRVSKTIVLIVTTVLVHVGCIFFPDFFLSTYQDIFFPSLRTIYDFTLGWLPWPFLYVVLSGLLAYILWAIASIGRQKTWKTSLNMKTISLQWAKCIVWAGCLFYWSWGFHYYQKNMLIRMGMEEIEIDSTYLSDELKRIIPTLNDLSDSFPPETTHSITAKGYVNMENEIRQTLEKILPVCGWQPHGRVRVKAVQPEGVLLQWSTAGIYIPHVFEGHIDKGLHPLQYPFTLAHEMAHGYGVTNEGDCNTLALMTCMQTGDPFFSYAALLTYFRYLWFDPRTAETTRMAISAMLGDKVRKDLAEIKAHSKKYPDLFPIWRDAVYEAYLHWMGVDDGLLSYRSMVDKVAVIKKVYPGLLTPDTNKMAK